MSDTSLSNKPLYKLIKKLKKLEFQWHSSCRITSVAQPDHCHSQPHRRANALKSLVPAETCAQDNVSFSSVSWAELSGATSSKNSTLPGKQCSFKKEVRGSISVSCWNGCVQGKSCPCVSILSTCLAEPWVLHKSQTMSQTPGDCSRRATY